MSISAGVTPANAKEYFHRQVDIPQDTGACRYPTRKMSARQRSKGVRAETQSQNHGREPLHNFNSNSSSKLIEQIVVIGLYYQVLLVPLQFRPCRSRCILDLFND